MSTDHPTPPDAETLAALRRRYTRPEAPRCPRCQGSMAWGGFGGTPPVTVFVCHSDNQVVQLPSGDPDVLALLDAYEATLANLAAERERAEKLCAERDQMIDLYTAQSQEATQLVVDARTALELRVEAQHQRDEAEAEVATLRVSHEAERNRANMAFQACDIAINSMVEHAERAGRSAIEVARLREAVDQLARLAGPGHQTGGGGRDCRAIEDDGGAE